MRFSSGFLALFFLGITGCPTDSSTLEPCTLVPPETGTLDTDGTRIVDQRGRAITLRGINTGGRSKFAPYAPVEFTDTSYDTAISAYISRTEHWDFNVLRVPFSWEAVEPVQGQIDEDFLDRYDRLIDLAWEWGMWTIVDFHQDVYAECYCGDGFPQWTVEDPPAPHHDCPEWFSYYLFDDDVKTAFDHFWADDTGVKTAYLEMWDRMATRYADHPGVIGFEPINEPGWGSGSRDEVMRDVVTPFYSEMATFLHERDPDALVFFDSNGQDALVAETGLERPDGDRLVFAPHFYDPSVIMQQGDLDLDAVTDSLQRWADKGEEWDVPVLLGEFGIEHDHDDAAAYLRQHYDFFDTAGMHATYWEYSDATELWNEEQLSVLGPDGEEREEVLDEIVRPYIRALGGTQVDAVPVYRPSPNNNLWIEYEPDGQEITEIVLSHFMEPLHVTGSGACYSIHQGTLLLQPDGSGDTVRVKVDFSGLW